jgi:hypothetical protein
MIEENRSSLSLQKELVNSLANIYPEWDQDNHYLFHRYLDDFEVS